MKTDAGSVRVLTEEPAPGPVPRYAVGDWERRFGVVAGVTGRGSAGAPFDFRLGDGDPPDSWARLLAAYPGWQGIAAGRQVHGRRIRRHGAVPGIVIVPDTDGHLTTEAGVLLAVTVADCVPVYLLDPGRRAVALLHAGWRGTAAGILETAVKAFLEVSSGSVNDIVMHCGVGICGSCYEVGSEVFEALSLGWSGAKGQLDLKDALAGRARALGIGTVTTSSWCSAHDPDFFSHRASRGLDGRMVAYLGLVPRDTFHPTSRASAP